MQLAVVHHHFRPGGVRRVIELGTPGVIAALQPAVTEVVLVSGEAPEPGWLAGFRGRLAPVPVAVRLDRAIGYLPGRCRAPAALRRRLRAFLESVLVSGPVKTRLVWVHNPGLGRNPPLARALVDVCAQHNIPTLFHHHDWWFDNRWQRWAEIRASGFPTLASVGAAILPAGPQFRHAAINRTDGALLRRYLGRQVGWIPNPADPAPRPAQERIEHARAWLQRRLDDDAPVWLVASRMLRRKNLAEAVLLTRWLRPTAWLATTGGVSSAGEQAYADTLAAAATAAGWRLRLGILAEAQPDMPSVAELLAASEVVLLTSLQEGFGLPFLEAAAARRPLVARALPNIMPDLLRFGFRLSYLYDEVLIAPGLFDWVAESRRQSALFQGWRERLPRSCRRLVRFAWLSAPQPPRPVPFSRLTLPAQLEVLQEPVTRSWDACLPLNPFLGRWRQQAQAAALRPARWPASAGRWLGGAAYAQRVGSLLARPVASLPGNAGAAAQAEFIRRTLREENLFPLTWADRWPQQQSSRAVE